MEVLVSVCIVTYNSHSTIIQTLESIKNQTYKNIELVVSDDGSKDETAKIVNEWIVQNKNRFTDAKLIVAEKNAGTACNLHKAIINSTGEWIKVLAGDDMLVENCIETFVKNAELNPTIQFFTCMVSVFSEKGIDTKIFQDNYDYLHFLQHKSKKAKQRMARYKLIYPGPEWFFSRKLYEVVDGMDLNYTMLDEFPFSFKVVKVGYEIKPIDEKLVLYRLGENSLSHTPNSFVQKIFLEQDYAFFINEQLPILKKNLMIFEILDQKLFFKIRKKQIEKFDQTGIYDTKLIRWRWLSPVTFFSKIEEKLQKFKHRKV